MHYLFKKAISIALVGSVIFSNSLQLLNSSVFAAEKAPNKCTRTVQGWSINPTDFSDIRITGTFNGDYLTENNETSMDAVALNLTNQFSKYHESKGFPLYSFQYDANSSVLYIVDSENNPVDSKKNIIEIFIINNTDSSEIVQDKEQTDGGFNDGLTYSNKDIPCETPPEENQCTPMTVQGWELYGNDFSNMYLQIFYNGELLGDADYTSLNDLIIGANKSIVSYQEKNGGLLYSLTVKNNIIYINDSENNPLDPKKDMIEIRITDKNNDGSYIIEDNKQVDGAYNEGLLYANQDISDCEETPPEENQCTPMTVQGWELYGNDFSNMYLQIFYNGELLGDADYTSLNDLIIGANVNLNSFHEKNGKSLYSLGSQNNTIYINDSDINPLDSNRDKLEIIIINNNDGSYIIEDNKQADGGYNEGLLYSNQEISGCTETPTEENAETAYPICENNMVGYDLIGKSEITSFISVSSKKYGINSKLAEPLTNKEAIQEYLNNNFGENQIIRYINTDKSITIRHNSEINLEDVIFGVVYEDNTTDKLQATTPTTHNLCDDDGGDDGNLPQVELTTYSICAPNIIYSSDQQVTCNFTVTNNGEVPANNVYVTEREMPDGFSIKKQSDNKPTVLNKGESVTYTIIGYQSIFPKQGSQVLTMGDVVFNYDYEKSSYDINTNTTIVVQLKKSSGSHGAGAGSNIIPVIINPTPTAPIPVVPVVPVVPTKPTSTGSTNTGSTGYKPIPVTPPTIIEIIKQETTKETIERVTAKVEDEGGVNFCVYEEYIPLNAWQDITDTEYSKDIRVLINKCIVNGLDNQMLYYGPNKVIKKGEVVKIIAKWFKLPISNEIKSANNKQRWLPYLTSMTNNKALVGLEKVWNEKTMNEAVDSDDVVTILKNIKSDANTDIIKQFDSNTMSRKVFAHIITRQ